MEASPPAADIERVLEMQRTAAQSLEGGDAQRAYLWLLEAIRALGQAYWSPEVCDDTALRLSSAESQFRRGLTAEAAETLGRVLATRLALYRERFPPVVAAPRARFCINCGTARVEGKPFCINCGARFPD